MSYDWYYLDIRQDLMMIDPRFWDRYPGTDEVVGLATVVDYAAQTYGEDQIVGLFTALGQYDTWEAYIPVVFGVAAVEFEVGWQEYLRSQYGIVIQP